MSVRGRPSYEVEVPPSRVCLLVLLEEAIARHGEFAHRSFFGGGRKLGAPGQVALKEVEIVHQAFLVAPGSARRLHTLSTGRDDGAMAR